MTATVHPSRYTREQWQHSVRRMDNTLRHAIQAYVEAHRVKGPDVAQGFDQLARFYLREDPDYTLRGTAVAYAFHYLGRRAAMLIAAFDHFFPDPFPSSYSVLDIGSGSGALQLALDLHTDRLIDRATFIEPSAAMADFARSLDTQHARDSEYVRIDLDQIVQHQPPMDAHDLIVLSAVFQYEHRNRPTAWWSTLASWVLQRCNEGAAVICIEPLGKADLALTFSGWLEDLGAENGQRYRVERVACKRLLPRVGKKRAELPRCTSLLTRWYPHLIASPHLGSGGRALIGPSQHTQMVAGAIQFDFNDDPTRPFPVTCWNDHSRYGESITCVRLR